MKGDRYDASRCTTPDLWQQRAARATDDGEGGIRRHIRGGWYGGNRPSEKHGLSGFMQADLSSNARC